MKLYRLKIQGGFRLDAEPIVSSLLPRPQNLHLHLRVAPA
jgi:hypothetical protein